MQYVLKIFENEDHEKFRVVDKNGDPWFVLVEVCRTLEIANPRDAAARLDEDEKDAVGITDVTGRRQTMTIINESGLWSLVLTSRKPEAKRFKKWLTSEVIPSIRKTGNYGRAAPAFIKRYHENWDRVSQGNFSILNEMVIHLWGRFENAGHILADRAPDGKENRPDVSAGRLFSTWLQKHHADVADTYGFYLHKTLEWEGPVRQYPFSMLPLFREFLDMEWIPNHAPRYLRTRDAAALPYLQRLLPAGNAAKPISKDRAIRRF